MRLGVDVGGTNTDAVVMDGDRLLARAKKSTTLLPRDGIARSVEHALKSAGIAPSSIQAAMIGTTHVTNALLEGRDLSTTAVLRLCAPANESVRPMLDWPKYLKNEIGEHFFWASGGAEYHGGSFSELDADEIRRIAIRMRCENLINVAIVGVFSPVNGDMEARAAEIILDEHPDANVTLSKDVGRLGFLERENAAILNACLGAVARRALAGFKDALRSVGVNARIFVSQNDGALMSEEYARRCPVLMSESGSTNSMIGASRIGGMDEAVVVDIGGTSTDIGLLIGGRPQEIILYQDANGIRTSFRTIAARSIPLGGGSRVQFSDEIRIGPDSVARDLEQESMVFGGDVLTVTDIAVAMGRVKIGDPSLVGHLPREKVEAADQRLHRLIETEIEKAKLTAAPTNVVLVGGGARLLSQSLRGVKNVFIPKHAGVANAIGAASARVGEEIDMMLSYRDLGRRGAIDKAKSEAFRRVVDAGAAPDTLKITQFEVIPLAYLSGNCVRIKIRAVGDLQI